MSDKEFNPTDLDRQPRDDGGPASNKTLRDEFAGQAMAGMLAAAANAHVGVTHEPIAERVAKLAYKVAAAMLAERKKP